jgi:hypothetical protein
MYKDLTGQITEAVSSKEFYVKWGMHFVRSIVRAHELKQCNNFKDPGVQFYGGRVFEDVRDFADDKFSSLPPPQPRPNPYTQVRSTSIPSTVISMASYNRSDNVCIHEDSIVQLWNFKSKAAREIVVGDRLADGTFVEIIVETKIDGEGFAEMVKVGALFITPWHPVQICGTWKFPCELGKVEWVPCTATYSFVTVHGEDEKIKKRGVCIEADGIKCATLAHGILGNPTLSHPFFGTEAVVDALSVLPGYEKGRVVFYQQEQRFLLRNQDSGLVAGFIERQTV